MLFILIFLFLIFPSPTYGYIDLGSGSYFIQVALAFLFGGLFLIKIYLKRIIKFLQNLFLYKKNKINLKTVVRIMKINQLLNNVILNNYQNPCIYS